MRKIVLLVMALILSLTMASAAFADQFDGLAIYGNSQLRSISDGQHGYSWNHSDASPAKIVALLRHEFNHMNWHRQWNHDPYAGLTIYQTTDQNGNPVYYTVR